MGWLWKTETSWSLNAILEKAKCLEKVFWKKKNYCWRNCGWILIEHMLPDSQIPFVIILISFLFFQHILKKMKEKSIFWIRMSHKAIFFIFHSLEELSSSHWQWNQMLNYFGFDFPFFLPLPTSYSIPILWTIKVSHEQISFLINVDIDQSMAVLHQVLIIQVVCGSFV